MRILAGAGGQRFGFAAMEIVVPPHFAGPIPQAHDDFDEAIYVLSGRLLVVGDGEPQAALPARYSCRRGQRHGVSNPSAEDARVLGLRSPPGPALAFMQDIGAALTPDPPPDPDLMRELYARHASRRCRDIRAAALPVLAGRRVACVASAGRHAMEGP
jgi:hypothetical protein